MPQKLVLITLFLQSFWTLSFNTKFTDSLWQFAAKKNAEEKIIFMLDQTFPVFNKDMQDGIEWGESVLNLSFSFGNEQYIGRSYLGLGSSHYLRGNYEYALASYQKALIHLEKINDKLYLGRTYNELTVYYRRVKDFDEAIRSSEKAEKLCDEAGDLICVESAYNNRAVTYSVMQENNMAKAFFLKAMKLALSNKNEIGLSYIYADMSEVYVNENNLDSAELLLYKALEIREEIKDLQGIAIVYVHLGGIEKKRKNWNNAKTFMEKALDIAYAVKYADLIRFCHAELFEVELGLNDVEKALYHNNRSNEISDSLLNREKMNSLSEMEVKFETEKVKKEKAEEEQKRILSELEVQARNRWIFFLSFICLTLFLIAIIILQRRNRKAAKEKAIAVLAEKERGLAAVFEATELERQRIAKDLHDGIGQQMSGLKLAWSHIYEGLLEESDQKVKLHQLTEILDQTASEVRDISHRMMPIILEEEGLVVALQEMLDKSFFQSEIAYSFDHFNMEKRLNHRLEISIYRIVQELINNVIKHSKATLVSVQLFKNGQQLILIVEDNGKGLSVSAKMKGHGLLNIQSRLNTVNGQVNFEGNEGAGTLVTIKVNLDDQNAV